MSLPQYNADRANTVIKKTAICLGSPESAKRAALYFDHVLHIYLGFDAAPRHPFWPDEIRHDHDASAHFGLMTHAHVMAGNSTGKVDDRFHVIKATDPRNHTDTPVLFPKMDGSTQQQLEQNYQNNTGGILNQLDEFLRRYEVKNTVFVSDLDDAFATSSDTPDPAIVLSGLPVVDTSNAKWDQVKDFREDNESVRACRRLCVFMHDELEGKSKDYIEDRVLAEVDSYQSACAKHGFKLLTGSLTTIFDQDSAIAASATTATALLLGVPLTAAAVSASAILIGKLSLRVAKDCYALRETKREHPISYIVQARDTLNAK